MATIVNNGSFCQVALPSGEPCIRTIASILRRYGFIVKTWAMGRQVTNVGTIRLTMIDVRPGNNPDTYSANGCNVNDCIRCHSANVGAF